MLRLLLIGCGIDDSLLRLSHFPQFYITNPQPTHVRTLPSVYITTAMFSARSVASAARTGARSYAAAAAAPAKSLKPPVALFGVDGTYASALVSPPIPTKKETEQQPLTESPVHRLR